MNRRDFLCSALAAGLLAANLRGEDAVKRFKLGVITDEVDRDLAKALEFVKEFKLEWIELRNVWETYIMDFSPEQISRAKSMVDELGLKVSCICTPFLKSQYPGSNPIRDNYRKSTLEDQFEILKRAIDVAHAFEAKNIRTFSFARCPNPNDLFQAAVDNIGKGAEMVQAEGLRLVLENIYDGTICTGEECARLCKAIPNKAFGLIWDPPNAYGLSGEQPYPGMYEALDPSRIYHVHLKDAVWKGDHHEWAVVGEGELDLLGQLRALLADQVDCSVSLETHANLNGSREAASRAGMPVLIDLMRQA
ncbi:MAG: sugar phosphate isomerase/epimerase [Acidobacteriota bacterium]|nr:MAG: sugar phosphate isomerase/epimerase [Acidobacteriota bacterium]